MPGTNTEYSRWSVAATVPSHLKNGIVFPLAQNKILVFDSTGKRSSVVYDVNHRRTVDEPRYKFAFRYGGGAHCIIRDNFICSMGGFASASSLTTNGGSPSALVVALAFDLRLCKWHNVPNLRRPRHGAACTTFNTNEVYVFGGTGVDGSLCPSGELLQWGNSRWQEIRMTVSRSNAAAVTLGRQIYLLGGDENRSYGRLTTDRVEKFDVDRQDWASSVPMKFARKDFLAFAIQGQAIVVIGGTGVDGRPVKEVEIFDVDRQQWGVFCMLDDSADPNYLQKLTGCVLGDDIFVYCGEKQELWKLHVHIDDFDEAIFEPEERNKSRIWSCPAANSAQKGSAVASKQESPSPYRASLRNPVRPKVRSAQDVPGRVTALKKWTADVTLLREKHLATIQDTVQKVEHAFNVQRDLEVQAVRQKAQMWLDETDQLLAEAKEEISAKKALLDEHRYDKHKLLAVSDDCGEPPKELCCPITLVVMRNPVLAADGNTYEKEALEVWFAKLPADKKPTSPMTGTEMESRAHFPNHAIRSLCQHFFRAQGARDLSAPKYAV